MIEAENINIGAGFYLAPDGEVLLDPNHPNAARLVSLFEEMVSLREDRAPHSPSPTTQETPMTAPIDPPAAPAARRPRQRGQARRILMWMGEHPGQFVTPARVVAEVPGMNTRQAQNALVALARNGSISRVSQGVYRYGPAPTSAVSLQHSGSLPVVETTSVNGTNGTNGTNGHHEPAPSTNGHHDVDETDLDLLLELILPDGYEFKVPHLGAIRRWQQHTAELLHALKA